jgi:DHA2 family methylenomycin A resistance protein-like MFS transporter
MITRPTPVIIGGFAVAALPVMVFVRVERRVGDPMLPLALFRRRAFSGGTAIGLLINLGFWRARVVEEPAGW